MSLTYSIIKYPAEILSTPTKELDIKSVTVDQVDEYMQHMIFLLNSRLDGVALAANQADMGLSMFLRKLDSNKHELIINPVIQEVIGEKVTVSNPEGCLSLADGDYYQDGLKRYNEIKVDYWKYPGLIRVEGEIISDFEAQVFQHEMDHLAGLTILDRLE